MSTREYNYAKNLPVRGNVMSGMDQILDKPRSRVIATAAQSIAVSGTNTAITFDNATANIDTDGLWSTSALDRLTIRTAGLYQVSWCVRWAASAAGTVRQGFISKGGITTFKWLPDTRPASNTASFNQASAPMALNAGDTLQILVLQDTGGALSTSTGGGDSVSAELSVCLIST